MVWIQSLLSALERLPMKAPCIVLGFVLVVATGLAEASSSNRQAGRKGDSQKTQFPLVLSVPDLLQSSSQGEVFYDQSRLVDIHIDFSPDDADWFPQLTDYYQLDLTIPARVSVDGQNLDEVGVRIKGSSSFTLTPGSKKKSFDLDLNSGFGKQRLHGYKKLNLNNGFIDPTMVREVLFLEICREYVPSARANLAELRIDENRWGAYTSVQQVNRDFFDEWFSNGKGNYWRGVVKPFRSARPLAWVGAELELYETYYELRSAQTGQAWEDLVEVIRLLAELPDHEFETQFDAYFAIDNALWLIALENVFMDNDSFLRKGYDYYIFQEPDHDRMFLIQHDGNEAFGSGTTGQWPEGELTKLDPFFQVDNPKFPLIGRLLSHPTLRQRYLAHLRTLVHEWLDWDVLEPRIARLQTLAEEAVDGSTATLYPKEKFRENVYKDWQADPDVFIPGLKPFVMARREFLLSHPEIAQTPPSIDSVVLANAVDDGVIHAGTPGIIQATLGSQVAAGEVYLYYTAETSAPFQRLPMFDDGSHADATAEDRVFGAAMPPMPAGTTLQYYIEARAAGDVATTSFSPPGAEHSFFVCKVVAPMAESRQVLINEVVTRNEQGFRDRQGEFEDWIELLNVSNSRFDLSGCYLSDSERNPRKWKFPDGTILASGERLVVFADNDENDASEFHANFKLSKDGETLILVDADSNRNQVLDRIEIARLKKDQAYGRFPDGSVTFRRMNPSPGLRNE